jgi:hypothetical protein
MAQQLTIEGALVIKEAVGDYQGQSQVTNTIAEKMSILQYQNTVYVLSADSAQTVALGALSEVNVLQIRVVGNKVRVRITSSDGTSQAIPVDSFLCIVTDSVSITAVDLTRTAGSETTVYVTICQKG